MRVYQVCTKLFVAAAILSAASSASEAGWFRGSARYYSYPADSTCYAATSPAPSAAPTQTAASTTAGPVVHQAHKPVIGAEPMPATLPAATSDAPRAMSGSGWSVTPRSSWDFGRFPPYR